MQILNHYVVHPKLYSWMSFLSQQKNENKNKAEKKKRGRRKCLGVMETFTLFFFWNIHSSDTVYGFLAGYAHGETYQNG